MKKLNHGTDGSRAMLFGVVAIASVILLALVGAIVSYKDENDFIVRCQSRGGVVLSETTLHSRNHRVCAAMREIFVTEPE